MLRFLRWMGIACLSTAVTSACGGSIVEDTADPGGTGGVGGNGGTAGTSSGGSGPTGGSGGAILDGGFHSDGGFDYDAACYVTIYSAEPIPRGLMVVIDRSVSMIDENKWDAVRDGLLGFAALPKTDGLNLALRSFPAAPTATIPTTCATDGDCGLYGPCLSSLCGGSYSPDSSCDPLDYATPEVAFAALPAAFSTIESTVQELAVDGLSTPTTPALESAATLAQSFSEAQEGIADIVLVTDGEPTGCTTNDVTSAAAVAGDAFKSPTPVRTFVIGLGMDSTVTAAIASSGGTSPAAMVVPGPGAASEVQSALEAVFRNTCAYHLPPFDDPSDVYAVNMVVQEPGQEENLIYTVGSSDDCDMADGMGWYYDDPASPTRIEFCPIACDLAQQPTFEVTIIVGCPTMESP